MRIPKAIQNLMEALERLPGIGSKTAARLTFYLLHVPEVERQRFGRAVLELGSKTAICRRCFNIAEPQATKSSPAVRPFDKLRVASSKVERRLRSSFDPELMTEGPLKSGETSDGKTPGVSADLTPGVKESEVEEAGILCDICRDPNRDLSVICVVEDPLDLMAFEKTGKYHGLYHVLQGVISPLEHIGAEDLKIEELIARLKSPAGETPPRNTSPRKHLRGVPQVRPHLGGGGIGEVGELAGVKEAGVEEAGTYGEQIKEIILATNPSLEGEATAMYIKQLIKREAGGRRHEAGREIKVTRIARGIPTGGDLEYADEVTLSRALEGRQEY